MSKKETMADWPLLRIVNELMKPSGRYTAAVVRNYRDAVRKYETFRGAEQSACEVTPHLLKKFSQSLVDQGRTGSCAIDNASRVAHVVRQADPDLMPNRHLGEYTSPEQGDLLYIMENEYFPSKSRIASEGTERGYKYVTTRYSKFLGRRATLDDLSDLSVGKWMRSLRKDGLAMATINGYVTKLRAFWNWCARIGMVEKYPTIEDFPEPIKIPDAYTQEETHRLVAAAAFMKGEILGVPASAWWEALHRVALDTAERTSALLDLQWRHYDAGDATLEAPAEIRKGGRKPMLYRLKPKTVALLEAIRATGSKKIFPFPWDRATFGNHYKKLLKLADLPYVPHRSGLQKVRRTFASHIEANGGNATMALAHTSRRLTEKSYLDPRIIKEPAHNERMFDV